MGIAFVIVTSALGVVATVVWLLNLQKGKSMDAEVRSRGEDVRWRWGPRVAALVAIVCLVAIYMYLDSFR